MIKKLKNKIKNTALKHLGHSLSPEYAQVSYAQEGEDILLWRIISPHLKSTGIYVEVGSNDPWKWSNTGFFYEKGWRGVAIDPNPDFASRFQSERPEDTFLNVGISNDPGTLTYYKFDISLLNTFSKEVADDLVKRGYGENLQKVQMQVVPLTSALEKVWPGGKSIDLLSVDAEGFDYKIIKSHDFERFPVKYVIVETSTLKLSDVPHDPFTLYLEEQGFTAVSKLCKSLIFFHSSQLYQL